MQVNYAITTMSCYVHSDRTSLDIQVLKVKQVTTDLLQVRQMARTSPRPCRGSTKRRVHLDQLHSCDLRRKCFTCNTQLIQTLILNI